MNAKSLVMPLVALWLAVGCSSTRTVRVPVGPRIDLQAYPTVGLVTFASNTKDAQLDRLSTQEFLEAVQFAQPGTRVVELGDEAQVLASVRAKGWNAAALRAIAERHGVDAIFIGRIDVERSKPNFELSSFVKRMSVSSDVKASLSARLLETKSGATVWTGAQQTTSNVAHADFNTRGEGHVGASDPNSVYGEMIDALVYDVTDAFRTHYVTRRVPRDQVASAGE